MSNNGHDMTVYRQWANRPADERFASWESFRAKIDHDSEVAKSATVSLKALRFEPGTHDGSLVLTHPRGTRAIAPSHWMFGQLGTQVGFPPSYLRTLEPSLAAQCANFGLSALPDDVKAKLYLADEGGSHYYGRAATGPEYGRIPNSSVADAVERLNDLSGGRFEAPWAWGKKFRSLFAGDRDMFVFMCDGGSIVDGGGDRDTMYRGFYVENSEVGYRVLRARSFLFRVVCGNFQIWGQSQISEVKIKHTKFAPYRFDRELYGDIKKFLDSSTGDDVAKIRAAKAFILPSKPEERVLWLRKRGFTATEAREGIATAEREEGTGETLWSVVQGLTRYSQTYAYLDARVDLDTRAGKLMDLVAA